MNNAPELQVRIDEVEIKRQEFKGDFKKALEIGEQMLAKYEAQNNDFIKQMLPGIRQKVAMLRVKNGIMPAASAPAGLP